jgi:hypothetical protein
MSTLKGNLGKTAKGDDESSMSDGSSDHEYELEQIRPQVYNSRSSLTKRKRKVICTWDCVGEWTVIVIAFIIFYVLCGLFTWALIMALLAESQKCLIAFGVIWIVFTITLIIVTVIVSERLRAERNRKRLELEEMEARKREENIARNAADNS